MSKQEANFTGFSIDTFNYLRALMINNDKDWFQENRNLYEQHLLGPFQNLVKDMGIMMRSIDPEFEIAPKIDKTISRIYRDVRFSKDKSPYRTSMWISFKRKTKTWKEEPGFYFEINPEFYRYGMGFFQATPKTMKTFREVIDNQPEVFEKATAFYKKQDRFELAGDPYKRVLDKSKSEEILNWYQRKNIFFICQKDIDESLFKPELIDELISGFKLLAPFYHFLWKIKNGENPDC